ncbi:hypothetical protein ACP4OV_018959 [Aristida adscensionis]
MANEQAAATSFHASNHPLIHAAIKEARYTNRRLIDATTLYKHTQLTTRSPGREHKAEPRHKSTKRSPEMKREEEGAFVDGGGEEEVDRKPVIKPGVHITLKVQDTDGRAVVRTVRRAEKLQALMDAYYAAVPAVARGTGKFLYDGRRLSGWLTPAELGMEENDEVDFFTDLMGGAGGRAVAAHA